MSSWHLDKSSLGSCATVRVGGGTHLPGPFLSVHPTVTSFGAFVDVGVGRDGLVPESQLQGAGLASGSAVTVWVSEVDLPRKRMLLVLDPRAAVGGSGKRPRQQGTDDGRARKRAG